MASLRGVLLLVLMFSMVGCGTMLGHVPTATHVPPTGTPEPVSVSVVGADLTVEQVGEARVIATGGVIEAVLSPDEAHIAFTRGAEGFPNSLWVIRVDGSEARELVGQDDLASSGGRPFVLDFDWLDADSVLYNTAHAYDEGVVNDDNLYRADTDGTVALMLPPGSGGVFAVSPNRAWIGVVTPGEQGLRGGVVRMVPPDGGRINEMLIYDEPGPSQEPPYYPPIRWREGVMYMQLYEIMPEGETRYICWEIHEPVLVGTESPGARLYGYARASERREDWC